MTGPIRPPEPFPRLLWLLRDPIARETVAGDLQEELQRLAAARGSRAARRWYRGAALHSVIDHWKGGRSPRPPRRRELGRGLGADLKIGLRMLRKDPGMTAIAAGALGLGIGLSTVGFAVLYGSVLRGLPYERAEELVHFERAQPSEDRFTLAVTPHDYEAWREQNRSFVALGAYVEALFLLGDEDGLAEQHWGVAISANSFELLGVEPIMGRGFRADEDSPGGPEVMMIGHGVWQGRFGADPEIIGRSVWVNGVDTRIVGVMPPEFGFPIAEGFWRPLRLDTGSIDRGSGRLDVFGRMQPGVTLEQARDDMARVTATLAEVFPETNAGIEARLQTFTEEYVGPEFGARVWTMLAASLLVALLASVNVATLLLARATGRVREVAVRTALGASRARIVRQLFLETAVLVTLGAMVGLGVASVGTALFERYWAGTSMFALPHGPDAPFWWRSGIDMPALVFVLAVTGATRYTCRPARRHAGRIDRAGMSRPAKRHLTRSRDRRSARPTGRSGSRRRRSAPCTAAAPRPWPRWGCVPRGRRP